MKSAFLLGAGSSVAAGFPSTNDLTEHVLSGRGVWRHTDGAFYIDGSGPPDEATQFATCMLRHLYEEAERYYSAYGGRHTNYEDLYYLAKQAVDEETGEMENPAIHSFVSGLKTKILPLIKSANENNDDPDKPWVPALPDSFRTLLRETCNYIADIVCRKLCYKPGSGSIGHLEVIANVCTSADIASLSTLCHDNHVETFLKERGIILSDGFSDEETGVRYWDGDFSSGSKTPFIKLHGSVDWFRLRPDDGDGYDEKIGVIPHYLDHFHTQTDDGRFQTSLDGRPQLLVGTFNKIQQYSSGIFRELHYRFRSTLNETDQIVVCGYGFGDKAINSEIINWYYKEQGRRLIIIHENPDDLVDNARGAIQINWSDWIDNSSLLLIKKPFEEVNVDDLEKLISCK